jgi:Heparinase II/III-like protein/Heparinase II/III N-terminus
VNLRKLVRAFREEPLPTLMQEAAWRAIRYFREAVFRRVGIGKSCPVHFRPIGYYRLEKQLATQTGCPVLAYADAILSGEYPLIGYGRPRLGPRPDWQCDWVSGKSWPLDDSEDLQLIRHDGSDVKAPWELSRLQWGPVVAKAYVLTSDRRYREALRTLLTDWIERNPIGKGVNWTVAMEAALRGISLCLTMDLLWPFAAEEQPWLDLLTNSLWQHLRFIEIHNEFSFLLRSNHYLSNIVGLTTLSAFLQGPGGKRELEKYGDAVQREILLQTYPDGGDCEASTGYHVLVAQLGLHFFVVQQRVAAAVAPEFEARLRMMFEWIAALADDAGKLPHLGDCDNGRVELLLDDMAQMSLAPNERHSLKVGGMVGMASHLLQLPLRSDQRDAEWLGCATEAPIHKPEQRAVSLMRDSGIAVLRSRDASVVFCAMPNGIGGKGSHTHCDKLSFVFRLGANEVFCDSGSRCYTRSVPLRNLDRSTEAHNTLVVDGANQNTVPTDPQLLFQCGNEAIVSPIAIAKGDEATARASHSGYSRYGIEHQRTVQLGERSLLIIDEVKKDATRDADQDKANRKAANGGREHSLDLRFILGPEWQATSEMMTGALVNCVIRGPRQMTLTCMAGSELTLSIVPTTISREYGAALAVCSIRIYTMTSLPAKVRTTVQWD